MNYQWYPGHMTKARRQMQEDLKLIDLMIELVDARVPAASRNPDIDELGKNKARLILLNKSDLADERGNDAWMEYFKGKGYSVVKVNSRSGAGMKAINSAVQEACKEKIERDRKRGILNRPVRAMVVGIPNVGKSTLLSRVTNAQPKIANYHFTTLYPHLGVIYVEEGVSFVMADIPGIIEGASEGAGLGHDFLRHIDRCRLLIHVVDVSGSEGRDPVEDFHAICAELKNYSIDLSNRPMIVAANKTDLLPPDSDNLERLRAAAEEAGCELYEISAGTTVGTRNLMRAVAERLRTLPPVTIYEPEYVEVIAEPTDPNAFDIEHYGSTWLVTGTWLERLVQNINFEDYESRNYFDQQLRKVGLFARLEEMGIADGDTVDIYDFEFEYQR